MNDITEMVAETNSNKIIKVYYLFSDPTIQVSDLFETEMVDQLGTLGSSEHPVSLPDILSLQ